MYLAVHRVLQEVALATVGRSGGGGQSGSKRWPIRRGCGYQRAAMGAKGVPSLVGA